MAYTKFITLLAIIFPLASCGGEKTYTYRELLPDCQVETIEARSLFILSCINNANPKSDEEPEDWLYICEEMAESLHCPMAVFSINRSEKGSTWRTTSKVKVGASE